MDATEHERKADAKLEARSKKRKRRTGRKAGANPWIEFYMNWRKENPDKVESVRDVKALVQLAREEYTPVNKGILCARCGHENQPPFTKAPTIK